MVPAGSALPEVHKVPTPAARVQRAGARHVTGHRSQTGAAPGKCPTTTAVRSAFRATGSSLIPDSRHVMSWRVGNHGFEMKLSSDVAEKIRTYLRPWMSEWLDQYGYTVESVGSWAVHPGGPRILQAVNKALGLPPEATQVSKQVLAEYGNITCHRRRCSLSWSECVDRTLPALASRSDSVRGWWPKRCSSSRQPTHHREASQQMTERAIHPNRRVG